MLNSVLYILSEYPVGALCKYSGNYIGIATISVVEVLGLVNVWALSNPISIILGSPCRQ